MSREIFFIEEISPDIVILPIKCGERPIKGIAGKMDWICGGVILRLIETNKVEEKEGEKILYFNPKKFPFPLLFVFYSRTALLQKNLQSVIKNLSPKKVFIDTSQLSGSLELKMNGIEIFTYSPKTI